MQTFFLRLIFSFLCIYVTQLAAANPEIRHAKEKHKQANHRISQSLDLELQRAFPKHAPGAVVMVMQNGKTLLHKAYGMASLELQVPMQVSHRFHIASVGKQLTAAAILRLAEQGHLKIKDPIRLYFPQLPENWNAITIEHLLTHTSGIRNLFEDASFRANAFAPHTPTQLLDKAITAPLLATPGDQFAYATVNYTLLAMIIEQLSGLSYAQFIAQSFLLPLGMSDTLFDQQTEIISNAVAPYQDGPRVAERFHPSVGFGGGSFYSSTADLAKWNQALHAGQILNQENTKSMHTNFQLNGGKRIAYGYGTRPHTLEGESYLQSNGDIQGFHSETVYLPKSKTYIAILSNGELFPYGLQPLAKRLAIIATGKPYDKPSVITLHEQQLGQLIGEYKKGEEHYSFHLKNGKLFLDFGGGTRPVALSAISATEFMYDSNPDFRIRFTIKPDGKHEAQWFEVFALDDDKDPILERVVIPAAF